jgi:redox-sensitive bicupin YhaK (pirin superfamily)
MGTAETLSDGDVQFMTAGKGIRHSEHNLHDTPLRFIQLWFVPRASGLKPNYGSMRGDAAKRRNQWHQIVTDVRHGDVPAATAAVGQEAAAGGDSRAAACAMVPIKINQDVDVFVTDMDKHKSVAYTVEPGRQVRAAPQLLQDRTRA